MLVGGQVQALEQEQEQVVERAQVGERVPAEEQVQALEQEQEQVVELAQVEEQELAEEQVQALEPVEGQVRAEEQEQSWD